MQDRQQGLMIGYAVALMIRVFALAMALRPEPPDLIEDARLGFHGGGRGCLEGDVQWLIQNQGPIDANVRPTVNGDMVAEFVMSPNAGIMLCLPSDAVVDAPGVLAQRF